MRATCSHNILLYTENMQKDCRCSSKTHSKRQLAKSDDVFVKLYLVIT